MISREDSFLTLYMSVKIVYIILWWIDFFTLHLEVKHGLFYQKNTILDYFFLQILIKSYWPANYIMLLENVSNILLIFNLFRARGCIVPKTTTFFIVLTDFLFSYISQKLLSAERTLLNGSTNGKDNFRPVSILPTVAKTFEQNLWTQVTAYIKNILSKFQFLFHLHTLDNAWEMEKCCFQKESL